MGHFGVGYHRGREHTVGVAFTQRHEAVGGEQYRRGNVVEFRLLILPAGSEIALELRVLFQLRIAVGREHLAVGVDVDVLSVGLLEQQLHVVQVVTAHNDERTFLDGERHLRRNRVAVGFSVGVVEQLHAFQVDGSGLEHQREQHVLRLVLAEVIERFVEIRVDLLTGLSQHPGVVGVSRHALQPEQYQGFQRADIRVAVPDFRHGVVLVFFGGQAVFFLLYLGFDGCYCGIVEIYVGDGGEKRFLDQRVGGLGGSAVFGCSSKSDERSDYLVLVVCGVRLFAADSRLAFAAGVVRGLLALETKHVFHCRYPFCFDLWAVGIIPGFISLIHRRIKFLLLQKSLKYATIYK